MHLSRSWNHLPGKRSGKQVWGAGEVGGRRSLQGAWPLPWSPVSLRLDGVYIQEHLDEELGGLVQAGKVGQHWDSFCSGRVYSALRSLICWKLQLDRGLLQEA